MNILIIGGNRFFGKRLTSLLIQEGHNVTLLNRGSLDDGFGDQVKRLKCDRDNKSALSKTVANQTWDIVYDQVCYDYETAKSACEVFAGKTKKYIFTSSQSVYKAGQNLKENNFNPSLHKFDKKESKDSDYSEAKRQAEVAFQEYADFPNVFVRFPIVIGDDDYTGRFKFHVDHIKNGEPIFFPNIDAKISFVSSDFAALALARFAKIDLVGPINVASPNPIKLKDLVAIIESAVGKKMIVAEKSTEASHSPYGIKEDWYMNCDKLRELGLVAPEISEWLPILCD